MKINKLVEFDHVGRGGRMNRMIILMIIMFRNIGFGVLALVAELNGSSWLAIIFVILEFLTLSTPVLKKVEYKSEEEE